MKHALAVSRVLEDFVDLVRQGLVPQLEGGSTRDEHIGEDHCDSQALDNEVETNGELQSPVPRPPTPPRPSQASPSSRLRSSTGLRTSLELRSPTEYVLETTTADADGDGDDVELTIVPRSGVVGAHPTETTNDEDDGVESDDDFKTPTWKLSNTVAASGRPRTTKKVVQKKTANAHDHTRRVYDYYEQSGSITSLAAAKAAKDANQFNLNEASRLLSALPVTEFSGTIRVYLRAKQPPSKLEDIHELLSMKTIRKVVQAMRRFSSSDKRNRPTVMSDTVAIVNGQAYSVQAIHLLRQIHQAKERLAIVESTLKWLDDDPRCPGPSVHWLQCDVEYREARRLMRACDVTKPSSALLGLSMKQMLDGDAIMCAMFGIKLTSDREAEFFSPNSTSYDTDSSSLLNSDLLVRDRHSQHPSTQLRTSTRPVYMIALHFDDPDHWCGIAIDEDRQTIALFDPLQSHVRYEKMRAWITNKLAPVANWLQRVPYNVTRFTGVQQEDNYNCGALVLLFLESYLHGTNGMALGVDSLSATLRHARYRYLVQCLQNQDRNL